MWAPVCFPVTEKMTLTLSTKLTLAPFFLSFLGTGWNGLISAKTYLEFRPSADLVILDDQKSFGGVWSKEKIYPSLYAQIKHGLFEYSFYPMRNEGVTADGYISGDTIHTYLSDFAQDFDLVRRTRLETSASAASLSLRVSRTPRKAAS